MGKHKGYYFYTIGQRSGLKLGGGPWYVVKKDIEKNVIYISRENLIDRARKEFVVGKFNWIGANNIPNENLKVKIRHGERFYNCKLELNDDTGIVKLEKEDLGIAAGQFAVFYNDDVCLGGSVILE
jgi:tRNA-specific 2-thiouridylase